VCIERLLKNSREDQFFGTREYSSAALKLSSILRTRVLDKAAAVKHAVHGAFAPSRHVFKVGVNVGASGKLASGDDNSQMAIVQHAVSVIMWASG
jgi:hypothetical protein